MNRKYDLPAAVLSYFGQPRFARFLDQLRSRYQASGGVARGFITLQNISDDEREALDGFYGMYTPDKQLSFKRYSVATFERLLRSSRFALTTPELFLILDGQNLLNRAEKRAVADALWNTLIQAALSRLEELLQAGKLAGSEKRQIFVEASVDWIEGLRDDTSPGVRILRNLFVSAPDTADQCLQACVRVMCVLFDRHAIVDEQSTALPIRLPVLAAIATGDAHALDWKYPLGRLFWCFVTAVFEQPFGGSYSGLLEEQMASDDGTVVSAVKEEPSLSRALFIREGYRCGGVADDDVSSQVLLFAPSWLQSWEERILTLRQVERLSPEQLESIRFSPVYVVENPSVFAMLVDAAVLRFGLPLLTADTQLPVLVCANGQPSLAVVKWLELFCSLSSQPSVYYSGDLDGKGVDIANGLWQRLAGAFHPWRMDTMLYHRYVMQGIPLTVTERERLQGAVYPWDQGLAFAMATAGIKLHQELWVDELQSDWLNAFNDHLGRERIYD